MIVLLACASSPTVADPWGAARAALLADSDRCFAAFAPYCLDELVDPALQGALDGHLHGRVPTDEAGVRKWVRLAAHPWAAAQAEAPDRVEQRVRGHYEALAAEVDGRVVRVDLGVPPGEIVSVRGGSTVESPLVADGEWADAGRVLAELRARHPGAERIEVTIRVPSGPALPSWRYRWERDRVLVFRPSDPANVYVGALGGSLRTRDLLACPRAGEDRVLPSSCPPPEALR